jgi:mRNA-degrading endonuclease toxin of MazEF toxin-antitoxin module
MASARFPMQGEVWWVNLDPTVGKEIKKRRPCLIVSPDDMNAHLGTVIAAPITSTIRVWPSRVAITLQRKKKLRCARSDSHHRWIAPDPQNDAHRP